ncbi:hypothetical protein KC343_g221 [Hortaea werneckii]|nr:hypothetical protein KC342_g13942 [Hortaea werneckii]KAI6851120.1 hypothetical protein KC350_g1755 [Hortaea werneckii]KAI6854128.1 hypothetical protein KC323_g8961 [Hortaea werneckii]KAI6855524.1 hypothetical protein KC338_g8853 [Hortaea werneckii]KAI7058426.1 hypothetical protein KC339_g17641 [Hortaea werneckii]
MFPTDNPKNTGRSINFVTAIGMSVLTEGKPVQETVQETVQNTSQTQRKKRELQSFSIAFPLKQSQERKLR